MAVNPLAKANSEPPHTDESKQTGQLGQRQVTPLSHSPIVPRSIVVTTAAQRGPREPVGTRSRDDSPSVVRTGGLGGMVFPRNGSPGVLLRKEFPAGGFTGSGMRPSFMGTLSAGSSPMPIPNKGTAGPVREPVGKPRLARQSSGPKYGSAPSTMTVEMGTQTEENN